LGQAADRIDEWQDDLRIFYVACTRAKQLLILSAGWQGAGPCEPDERGGTRIPPSHVNHLTATLAERFDLKSGRCLDPSVPPSVTASIQVRYEMPNSEAPSVIGDMKPVPEPQPAPPAGLLEPPSAEGINRDPFDIHDSPATEWNCLK
jgi:hypothetical protein